MFKLYRGTLGSVDELYYVETGKEEFFKYMSAPLARLTSCERKDLNLSS